ncbi:hypothetical protein F3Y22_tig00110893pilonHSYRG00442 [Hibiscus syriacus]|uniref:DUF4220 domain-containing protein n=1 Tax=Hibiscus syriacus TaxID=106335 RepID=A0A6A2ZHY3_HIBSY|nr:hypothetical protein F3Y22_tig00110893pilonHSYRG00442 [Hibiscus syriacus]
MRKGLSLRSASSEQLQDALYTEAACSRGSETGLFESTEPEMDPRLRFLGKAYKSFENFKSLFLELPFEVSNKYHEERVFLKDKSADEAFRLVNIELQFLYDLFFTKNPLQHLIPAATSICCTNGWLLPRCIRLRPSCKEVSYVMTWVEADSDMKKFIYNGLAKEAYGKDESKQMPASLTGAIVICRIATMIVDDRSSDTENEGSGGSSLRLASNILSDYMMASFIVKKKGLKKASASSVRAGVEGYSCLLA